ncbi:MAG: BON domain-containing protein [Methylobacter sp.]
MKITNEYKQNILANKVLVMICLTAVFGLAGCQKEGSAEKAGKQIDRAAENAEQKIEQTTQQAEEKIEAAKESVSDKAQAAGEYIDDSAITSKVKAAILSDPLLSGANIEVTTTQGVVTLNGMVNSEPAIDRAIEVANTQKDVKSVQSKLIVKIGK